MQFSGQRTNRASAGPRHSPARLHVCARLLATLFILFAAIAIPSARGQTNAAIPTPPSLTETNYEEVLRAYLQLQEQLHATQLSVERTREQTDASAARSAETLAVRLQAIEQALASQRSRELEAMQSSNRVMLIVAGTFAAVGVLAMLVTAFFQWRSLNRLAEISTGLPAFHALGPATPLAALGPGDGHLVSAGAADQSNLRLLGALDSLEQRIHQLEHATTPGDSNGKPTPARLADGVSPGAAIQQSNNSSEQTHSALIGKGQSLLNLDKADEALACFDEILAHDPKHTDALVKKGTALERLRKLDEAIQCYDQAIAADQSLTIAYLYKAGLFNRQDRFGEALQCYEQALRTQEKH
jgi:tetratricopeptide (TPR) repeat protein